MLSEEVKSKTVAMVEADQVVLFMKGSRSITQKAGGDAMFSLKIIR